MRWLITGAGGMLGTDLRDELVSRGEDVVALTRSDFDITDSRIVNARIADEHPSIVINCAAHTKVDQAESEESLANAINGSAVELITAAANSVDALLVQISTDFVFDGTKRTPYEVTDATAPVSAYGRSKVLGEVAAR
ncbi:MAG TPA: sugar nucleotide-binding protein, partial [Thermoanaerobaculia bacterium]|nr:sugar nucleotide-binding protein [Thermoanaerobaculia bacterium]